MSTNTTILTGSFTSTGANTFVALRSGVAWMRTFNVTAITTPVNNDCFRADWQYGFADASAVITKYVSASTANLETYSNGAGGFTLIDTSESVAGTINATVTAVSTAAIPVVTNTGTNGLVAGDIVRMINVTSAQQLGGMDFTVGYNTLSSTTFSLDYMSQLAAAGTTGSWMKVAYDPIFYPRRRTITKITQATSAVVTLSVTHGYKVGQQVRMVVPDAYGMTQMNGLQATITAINTTTTTGNTITIDIDSSAFTAFAFPASAAVPFTPAEVVPMGEDTAYALSQGVDILSDATLNTAQIGMLLTGGASYPAGASGDVIYWQAGTSFNQP